MTEEEILTKLKRIQVCGDKDYLWNFEAGIILNLIEKQSKAINEMAKAWKQDDVRSVKEIKQYLYRKVEEDE